MCKRLLKAIDQKNPNDIENVLTEIEQSLPHNTIPENDREQLAKARVLAQNLRSTKSMIKRLLVQNLQLA